MASPSCRKVCRSQGNPVEPGPSLAFTRRCRILVNPASASCRCCCEHSHQKGRQAALVSRRDDVMCLVGMTGSADWRSHGMQSGARHSSPTPAMLDPLPVQFGRQPGDAGCASTSHAPQQRGGQPQAEAWVLRPRHPLKTGTPALASARLPAQDLISVHPLLLGACIKRCAPPPW